jgi:hypothetical protein
MPHPSRKVANTPSISIQYVASEAESYYRITIVRPARQPLKLVGGSTRRGRFAMEGARFSLEIVSVVFARFAEMLARYVSIHTRHELLSSLDDISISPSKDADMHLLHFASLIDFEVTSAEILALQDLCARLFVPITAAPKKPGGKGRLVAVPAAAITRTKR